MATTDWVGGVELQHEVRDLRVQRNGPRHRAGYAHGHRHELHGVEVPEPVPVQPLGGVGSQPGPGGRALQDLRGRPPGLLLQGQRVRAGRGGDQAVAELHSVRQLVRDHLAPAAPALEHGLAERDTVPVRPAPALAAAQDRRPAHAQELAGLVEPGVQLKRIQHLVPPATGYRLLPDRLPPASRTCNRGGRRKTTASPAKRKVSPWPMIEVRPAYGITQEDELNPSRTAAGYDLPLGRMLLDLVGRAYRAASQRSPVASEDCSADPACPLRRQQNTPFRRPQPIKRIPGESRLRR